MHELVTWLQQEHDLLLAQMSKNNRWRSLSIAPLLFSNPTLLLGHFLTANSSQQVSLSDSQTTLTNELFNLYVLPHLWTITANDINEQMTLAALDFIYKLFSFHSQALGSSQQFQLILKSICQCQFEATDTQTDECCLYTILNILLKAMEIGCQTHSSVFLTNEMICQMIETSFSMLFQMRLSESLRKSAEKTLQQILYSLLQYLLKRRQMHVADEGEKEAPQIHPNLNTLGPLVHSPPLQPLPTDRKEENLEFVHVESSDLVRSMSNLDLKRNSNFELTSEKKENDVRIHPMNQDALVEIFRFIVDLGSPVDQNHTDQMRWHSIQMMNFILENKGFIFIQENDIIKNLVALEGFRYWLTLLRNSLLLSNMSLFQALMRLFLNFFSQNDPSSRLPDLFHPQYESFLSIILTFMEQTAPTFDLLDPMFSVSNSKFLGLDQQQKDEVRVKKFARFFQFYGIELTGESSDAVSVFKLFASLPDPTKAQTLFNTFLPKNISHTFRSMFMYGSGYNQQPQPTPLHLSFTTMPVIQSPMPSSSLPNSLPSIPAPSPNTPFPMLPSDPRGIILSFLHQISLTLPNRAQKVSLEKDFHNHLFLKSDCEIKGEDLWERLLKQMVLNVIGPTVIRESMLFHPLESIDKIIEQIQSGPHCLFLTQLSQPFPSPPLNYYHHHLHSFMPNVFAYQKNVESQEALSLAGYRSVSALGLQWLVSLAERYLERVLSVGYVVSTKSVQSEQQKPLLKIIDNKHLKKKNLYAAWLFENRGSKEFLDYLFQNGLLKDKQDSDAIAGLLFHMPLDKKKLGEFLAKPVNEKILHAYMKSLKYQMNRKIRIDEALRMLLERFRLPGESQQIERVVSAFAGVYFDQIQKEAQNWLKEHSLEKFPAPQEAPPLSIDSIFVLSYAIIMLNTDQHNPQVKRRMTKEDFIRNNRGTNSCNRNGKDENHHFFASYLGDIYDSIKAKEIIVPDEHIGEIGFDYQLREMCRRFQQQQEEVKDSFFESAKDSDLTRKERIQNQVLLDREQFVTVWKFLSAASLYTFHTTDSHWMLQKSILLFHLLCALSFYYGLKQQLDSLMISIWHASRLSFIKPIEQKPLEAKTIQKVFWVSEEVLSREFLKYKKEKYRFVLNLSQNFHSQIASVMAFKNTNEYGHVAESSWLMFLDACQILYINDLLPHTLNLLDFASMKPTETLSRLQMQKPSQISGSASNLHASQPSPSLFSAISSFLLSTSSPNSEDQENEVSEKDQSQTLASNLLSYQPTKEESQAEQTCLELVQKDFSIERILFERLPSLPNVTEQLSFMLNELNERLTAYDTEQQQQNLCNWFQKIEKKIWLNVWLTQITLKSPATQKQFCPLFYNFVFEKCILDYKKCSWIEVLVAIKCWTWFLIETIPIWDSLYSLLKKDLLLMTLEIFDQILKFTSPSIQEDLNDHKRIDLQTGLLPDQKMASVIGEEVAICLYRLFENLFTTGNQKENGQLSLPLKVNCVDSEKLLQRIPQILQAMTGSLLYTKPILFYPLQKFNSQNLKQEWYWKCLKLFLTSLKPNFPFSSETIFCLNHARLFQDLIQLLMMNIRNNFSDFYVLPTPSLFKQQSSFHSHDSVNEEQETLVSAKLVANRLATALQQPPKQQQQQQNKLVKKEEPILSQQDEYLKYLEQKAFQCLDWLFQWLVQLSDKKEFQFSVSLLESPLFQSQSKSQAIWELYWMPVLNALAENCRHPHRLIRQHSFSLLQRACLLAQPKDDDVFPRFVFTQILFPLTELFLNFQEENTLTELKSLKHQQSGLSGEDLKSKVITNLCRVFLQYSNYYLKQLHLKNKDIQELWFQILEYMKSFYNQSFEISESHSICEAIKESLRNALVVMQGLGFFDEKQFWDQTWEQLHAWLPELNLYPAEEQKEEVKKEPKEPEEQEQAIQEQ